MNTSRLKTYAPEARRAFITAVTAEAARYGIREGGADEPRLQGDVMLIAGHAFPRALAEARSRLLDRVRAEGFAATMESIAYTWFNRLVAIRYMELHGYLDHGYRVLSHPEGKKRPQILDHAFDVNLPGLHRDTVVALKLDGTGDEELYRLILKAQCDALQAALPFLFALTDHETELLLPTNLLHTDSLVRQLVEHIEEESWQDVEIVGWLYQFYISEKKDQVIGKVVKSEDIPAATQLFTPNWIVKYMVQNSLGAQWLSTYPQSPLKGQMAYYIEPAEQTESVKAQLAAITPAALNPEELTLIDPACGSGHILVEAYDLFKAIYLERGYRLRDVPSLILTHNLFGLDIDERAAQLTRFALMMKGRADDRRLFERGLLPNVMTVVDSAGIEVELIARGVKLGDYGFYSSDLAELKRIFEHGSTFGSLIQVTDELAAKLPAMRRLTGAKVQDMYVDGALKRLVPIVRQAELLASRYDAVVANPPYMGGKGMNALVKDFAKTHFPDAKSDVFACFMERGFSLARQSGHCAMITMQSWMFLSSFEKMRGNLLRERTMRTMAHLGARAFGSISGEVVQTTVFSSRPISVFGYKPVFFRLVEGDETGKREALMRGENRYDSISQSDFDSIPGNAIAYWASEAVRKEFSGSPPLSSTIETREGLTTGSNDRFLRYWYEVPLINIGFGCKASSDTRELPLRWFPYLKGGEFRRWAGNTDYIVNWYSDGRELKNFVDPATGRVRSHNYNGDYAFRSGITWSGISSGTFSVRLAPEGFMFDAKGPMGFAIRKDETPGIAGLLNSSVVGYLLKMLAPTLDFKLGHVLNLPLKYRATSRAGPCVAICSKLSSDDWNAYERSWDFQSLPIRPFSPDTTATLESRYAAWAAQNRATIAEMRRLEEENNRLFIDVYGLADELSPEVPLDQITLTVNPAYRYGGNLSEEEGWTRFRADTMQELISYAIGCMMGRYSLDEAGLIYAHAGNEGFDPTRYTSFPADEDGIIPLTDTAWFTDDALGRLVDFVAVAWDKVHLEKNLAFLAESLSPAKDESSRDTLRRYLCTEYFGDHLQTYKNRPIYWMFSSGKQRQAAGLPVPRLPASVQRRHPGANAGRVCHPVTGQDGGAYRDAGPRCGGSQLHRPPEAAGEGEDEAGEAADRAARL